MPINRETRTIEPSEPEVEEVVPCDPHWHHANCEYGDLHADGFVVSRLPTRDLPRAGPYTLMGLDLICNCKDAIAKAGDGGPHVSLVGIYISRSEALDLAEAFLRVAGTLGDDGVIRDTGPDGGDAGEKGR